MEETGSEAADLMQCIDWDEVEAQSFTYVTIIRGHSGAHMRGQALCQLLGIFLANPQTTP